MIKISEVITFLLSISHAIAAPATLVARANPSEPPDPTPEITIITSVSGTETFTATFTAASFSQYATFSAAQTITTTEADGTAIIAVIAAAGLGWIAALPAIGQPIIDPPNVPPEPGNIETWDEITTATTETTPTSTEQRFPIQTPPYDIIPLPDNQVLLSIATIEIDNLSCGFNNDDEASIDRTDAMNNINDFCKTNANHKIPATTSLFKVDTIGSGMELNLSVSVIPSFASYGDQQLDQDDCTYFFGRTVDDCDTTTVTNKMGGTVTDTYLKYVFHPINSNGELTCTGTASGTGVTQNEAQNAINDFCKSKAGTTFTGGDSQETTYGMTLGDSQIVINVGYQQSDSCSSYTVNADSCTRFLTRTINECNQNTNPYGKYGGQVIDYCGIYTLSTKVDEQILCNSVPSLGLTGHVLDMLNAQKAINAYCSENQPMDPANQPSIDQFSQAAQGDYTYTGEQNDGWIIRMRVKWDPPQAVPYSAAVPDAQTCFASQKFNLQGSECTRKLTNILNRCKYKIRWY
jgi:hypothetical protein